MHFQSTDLAGVLLVEPDVHRDARGYFLETYHADKYRHGGVPGSFVQDNQSYSTRNTLRGLHTQVTKPQGKLVRAVSWETWDVAVDVRSGSATFGRWSGTYLSSDNFRQLYVPEGCAHGFCVISNTALVEYKCTALYDPTDEVGIAFNDPILDIAWPVTAPILSDRDKQHRFMADLLREWSQHRRMVLS